MKEIMMTAVVLATVSVLHDHYLCTCMTTVPALKEIFLILLFTVIAILI